MQATISQLRQACMVSTATLRCATAACHTLPHEECTEANWSLCKQNTSTLLISASQLQLQRVTVLRCLHRGDAQADPASLGAASAALWDIKGRAAAEEARARRLKWSWLRHNFSTEPRFRDAAVQTDGTGQDADDGHGDAGPNGDGDRPAADDGLEPLRHREQAAAVPWLPEPHGWRLASAASMSTSGGSGSRV